LGSAQRCQATAQRVRHMVCEPPRTRRTCGTDKVWPRGARMHWSVSGPDGARPSQTSRTRPALRVGCARIGAPILAGFLLQLCADSSEPGAKQLGAKQPLEPGEGFKSQLSLFSRASEHGSLIPHPTVLSRNLSPHLTQGCTGANDAAAPQGRRGGTSRPCAVQTRCYVWHATRPAATVVHTLAVSLGTKVLMCLALCVTAWALAAAALSASCSRTPSCEADSHASRQHTVHATSALACMQAQGPAQVYRKVTPRWGSVMPAAVKPGAPGNVHFMPAALTMAASGRPRPPSSAALS